MSAPLDTAPLPRDAALPQLPLALDGDSMAGVFAELLRPHGVRVEGCRVERVKYRPGRNATLAYRLVLRDAQHRAFEQPVAARLCGGQGAARSARASQAALQASRAGPALRWVPGLDLLTWWWPNDAKLAAPRVLADAARLQRELLPPLLAALDAPATAIERFDVTVVQYVPEHRVCARFDLRWLAAGATRARSVYAKASREPDGAVAHGLLAQLQATPAWCDGSLRTPRALLWHAPSGLGIQEAMPGRPLLDAGHDAIEGCAAPLGAQLATLHRSDIAVAREVTPATLRDRLAEVVGVLAPALGEAPVRRAAAALDAGLDTLDGQPMRTLHGDFHARNILVDEGPQGPIVSLIDLDGLRRGPALLELGAWQADAIYRALLDGASPARDANALRRLIDAYVDAGGQRPDPGALRWATAWSLLTQRAWRCAVNLKPGRWPLAPRLVTRAARLAEALDEEALWC